MAQIHPLAVVSPDASLASDVSIGPFCVVEPVVTLGSGCRLDSHVVVKAGTVLGRDNLIGAGAVLGAAAQHLRAGAQPGGLRIGDRNTIRENVTIHRALAAGGWTTVGDENLLMVSAHIGHDCCVGNGTILANNVMVAGHCTLEDHAYLSGAVGIHQFCRVGRHAMVGGQAHLSQDVAPYVTVDGVTSQIVGLNLIGLRRHGFSEGEIAQLKEAYRVVFRSGWKWEEILRELQVRFTRGPAAELHPFFAGSRRGCVRERRMPRAATLKLYRDKPTAAETPARRKAG